MDEFILTLKKLLKPIVWKGLDVYEQNFSSKSRKAKKFDRLVKTNRIYFTTNVNTEGFSDQIARLSFFYKVGRSLGFNYHYTPLVSNRSASLAAEENLDSFEDIYDFIGINKHLKKLSSPVPKAGCEHIVIDLEKMDFERRSGTSYRNFIFYLKLKIFDRIQGRENVVVHFKGSRSVFHFYRITANIQSDLELRQWYLEHRVARPWKSVFEKNKINMLVHIRQGDTAIIETPWKSFIGVSYKIQNKFEQLASKEAVGDYEVIDTDVYKKFLKELFSNFDNKEFSVAVFSDGFKRAIREILNNRKFMGLEDSQIKELEKLENVYDRTQFRDFVEWNEVKTFFGEEKKTLFNLVHSFFESDIIIFGTQAKFIPKLVAAYSDPGEFPLMICLYQQNHPHVDYLGISHSSERILFVDIHNYDIQEISNHIRKYLLSGKEENKVQFN